MKLKTKTLFCTLIIFSLLGISLNILAEDIISAPPNEISEEEIGELAEPEDLDVEEPTILPNSPFYFIKEWGRAIQSFFAFGRIKKTELEQKFANERLIELKQLISQDVGSNIIEKATEKYERSIEKVRKKAEEIEQKAEENEKVKSFLEKFTRHQLLHQEILERLSEQVPEEVFEKIENARQKHLENFEGVMNKLETKEQERNQIKEKAKEQVIERIRNRTKTEEKQKGQE